MFIKVRRIFLLLIQQHVVKYQQFDLLFIILVRPVVLGRHIGLFVILGIIIKRLGLHGVIKLIIKQFIIQQLIVQQLVIKQLFVFQFVFIQLFIILKQHGRHLAH